MHHILGCLSALSAHTPERLHTTLRHKHVPVASVIGGVRAWCVDQFGNAPSGVGVGGRVDGLSGTGGSGGGSSTVGGGGGTGVSGAAPEVAGDRCHYWAKGTGFGTGSTMQSWDVEHAMIRQRVQEEHIVWLLRLLHSFIDPSDTASKAAETLASSLSKQSTSSSTSIKNNINKDSTLTKAPAVTNKVIPKIAIQSNNTNAIENSNIDNVRNCVPEVESIVEDVYAAKIDSIFTELCTLICNTEFMDKIASHLSNDSVLDLSRHVPLYRAILSFVRSIAATDALCPLLVHNPPSSQAADDHPSLLSLLTKMSRTVDQYISKLTGKSGSNKTKKSSGVNNNGSTISSNDTVKSLCKAIWNIDNIYEASMKAARSSLDELGASSDDTDDEGLLQLVPDLQLTEKLVKIALERLRIDRGEADPCDVGNTAAAIDVEHTSLRDIYLRTMEKMQFDTFEMVLEDESTGNIRFTVTHLFEGTLRNISTCMAPRRIKRLAQEAVTLSTSLPLSFSSSVFIRTDTDRLDIMKVHFVAVSCNLWESFFSIFTDLFLQLLYFIVEYYVIDEY